MNVKRGRGTCDREGEGYTCVCYLFALFLAVFSSASTFFSANLIKKAVSLSSAFAVSSIHCCLVISYLRKCLYTWNTSLPAPALEPAHVCVVCVCVCVMCVCHVCVCHVYISDTNKNCHDTSLILSLLYL